MSSAIRSAQAERCAQKADDGLARAWERLADAADALDALLVREELYESQPDPGLIAVIRD